MPAAPEVFALVSLATDLSPGGVVLAAQPEVVSGVDLEGSEPGVVSDADIAGPPAPGDIAVAFDDLVPVAGVLIEGDSSGRPKSRAVPNADHSASSASSVEVVGEESVGSPTGARPKHGLCSNLANRGLHQNKNVAHGHNKPTPGYNPGSDTTDLPMDATTTHSRKTGLPLYQARRTHCSYQASLSQPEVPEIRWGVAGKFQYLCLPLPSLE